MSRSILFALAALLLLSRSSVPTPTLRHDAYVWQRAWTPAVTAALRRSRDLIGGWHVLAAEIDPQGKLSRIEPDWASLAETDAPVTAVLRIDGRLELDRQASIPAIVAAMVAAVPRLAGVEIDYDCPTSALPTYTALLRQIRTRLPRRYALGITALPTWLGASAFPALAEAADGVVLQVHAVADPHHGLFDPAEALAWARAMGRVSATPFMLALPAYQVRVGWSDGGLASVAGEMPVLEAADGEELAASPRQVEDVIRDIARDPPPNLTGIAWFRLPTDADRRSWSFATWRAVIRNETLEDRVVIRSQAAGDSGAQDLVLVNEGVTDAISPRAVPIPVGCRYADGAGGYALDTGDSGTVLRIAAGRLIRAGETMKIGWTRCGGSADHAG